MKRPTLIAFLIYALVTVIFFFPSLFGGAVPLPTDLTHDYLRGDKPTGENTWIRDSVVQMYPYVDVLFDSYKRGEWPTWNPSLFNGVGFANGQSSAFSPISLLIPFFDDSLSFFAATVLLYFCLAGLGMFLFLKQQTHHWLIALSGGLAWQLSGPMMMWLAWGTIDGVLALFPFLLWAIDRSIKKWDWKWLSVVTIIHYSMLTAGHVQFYLYALGIVIAYGGSQLWQHRAEVRRNRRTQQIIAVALCILLNLLLMYIILHPFILQSELSHRIQSINKSHLEVVHLAQWVLPNVWGDVMHYKAPLNYVETTVYVGVLPLLLCGVLLFFPKFWKQQQILFWPVISCLVLIYTFFPQLIRSFANIIPLFASVPPFRSLFILSFAVIIVGFIGLDWLIQNTSLFKSLKIKKEHILIGVCLFVLFDQWIVFHGFTPQQSRDPLLHPPAYVTFIQHQKEQPLIYSEVSPLNLYSVYDIRSLFGYDSTYPETYYQDIKSHGEILSHHNILNARIDDLEFLRRLRVDFIVSKRAFDLPLLFEDGEIRIYEL